MRQFIGLLSLVAVTVIGREAFPSSGSEPQAESDVPSPLESRVDTTFRFGETNITNIRDIELFPDGTIAYGGVGQYATIGYARPDGTLINPNSGGVLLSVANSISLDVVDRAVYGGGLGLTVYPGGAPAVARVAVWDDGTWDFFEKVQGNISRVLPLGDRDVLLAGRITLPGDMNSYGLVRLELSGAIDRDFPYTNFVGFQVTDAAVTANGGILAAYQTANGGFTMQGFGRWFRSGARDTNYDGTWAVTGGTNSHVSVIRKAPGTNGFIAAVEHWLAGPEAPKGTQLIELDEQGRPVGSLLPAPYINGVVHAIAFEVVRPETAARNGYDRVIVGGDFTHVAEAPFNKLAAISKDGTVAWGLGASDGPAGTIRAIEVQLDGKVLIGGTFTNVGAVQANGMARLEGNSGKAQYLHWADSELRAFEKTGQGVLTLVRSGNVSDSLTVDLSIGGEGTSGSAIGLPEIPAQIHFEAKETVVSVPVAVRNNDFREPRRTLVVFASLTNTNVLLTRSKTRFVVLDDETPGTMDPSFQASVGPGFYTMGLQTDGKMVVGGETTRLVRLNLDGSVDPTFVTNGIAMAPAFWQEISQIKPQADGKIYVAGRFHDTPTTNTYGINYVGRMNPDGTLDRSFDPRLSKAIQNESNGVLMEVLEDGDVMIWLGGMVRREVVFSDALLRLKPTGEIRRTFAGVPAWKDVAQLKSSPDGSVFVYASTGNGILGGQVTKFSATGQRDTNFVAVVPSTIGNGYVYEMEMIGDWLWLAGSFRHVNSVPAPFLTRVNVHSGVVDTNLNVLLNAEVNEIAFAGGKIYIGGSFTTVNGKDRVRIARLNSDGSLDESFDAGDVSNRAVGLIEVQQDGKVIIGRGGDGVGGSFFARLEGDATPGEIRFLSRRIVLSETDGTALIEVERVGGSSGALSATLETVEGSALAGANFVATNTTVTFLDGEFGRRTVRIPLIPVEARTGSRTFAVKLTSRGVTEEASVLIHDSTSVLSGQQAAIDGAVRDMAVGPGGAVYLAGNFIGVNGFAVTNLARLNSDLSVDTNFSLVAPPVRPETSGSSNRLVVPIESVAVRANGQVLFSGGFTEIGTNRWRYLAQVNADGTYDHSFNESNRVTQAVTTAAGDIILQPDGQLIVTPGSTTGWGKRVNVDGSIDPTFLGDFRNQPLALAPEGYIYAVSSLGPNKFLPDGSVDLSFEVPLTYRVTGSLPPSPYLNTLAVQPDGKVLLGGAFSHVGLVSPTTPERPRLVRVFSNGRLDTNFVANVGTNAPSSLPKNKVTAIQVLANGRILIGGNFEQVEGQRRSMVALLDPNGRLRDDFRPEVQGESIDQFALLSDGDVVVRGNVRTVDGAEVGNVFKLDLPEEFAPVVQILWPTNGTEILLSDVVVPFEVEVKAFDVDGFLENVVVELDGVAVATNSTGGKFILERPREGDHVLTVTATDEQGLQSSGTVRFHVSVIPFPGQIHAERDRDGVMIRYTSGKLQGSTDLKTWTDVHIGGGEFRPTEVERHQFFRARW